MTVHCGSWRSAFFTVQLSHPYLTTGKTIPLTRRTFVDKVMSPLLNMLSRLVITFLPRSKRLLISWLQSPSAVILEPPKIKSDTVSTVSPSICHEVMGLDGMMLVFWMLSFKPTFRNLGKLKKKGWFLTWNTQISCLHCSGHFLHPPFSPPMGPKTRGLGKPGRLRPELLSLWIWDYPKFLRGGNSHLPYSHSSILSP